MKRSLLQRFFFLVFALTLVAAACGDDDDVAGDDTSSDSAAADADPADEEPEEQPPADEEPEEQQPADEEPEEQMSFIYISPDPIGVNEFLISAQTGTELAAANAGATVQVFESEDPTTRADNLRAAVDAGADVVVLAGFQFDELLPETAMENPDMDFLVVTSCPAGDPLPNVHCALFQVHEAAFVAGAVAGTLTETDQVGAVVAIEAPLFQRFSEGFAAGAEWANPDATSDARFVGGENPFADAARAKELALALAADGADVILGATGGGDFGVYEAAAEEGFLTFGANGVNLCSVDPTVILDNIIQRSDLAIESSVGRIIEGTDSDINSYGVDSGFLGLYSNVGEDPASGGCLIETLPEAVQIAADAVDAIVSGEVEVPDPLFG